jgi:hypothetical protein
VAAQPAPICLGLGLWFHADPIEFGASSREPISPLLSDPCFLGVALLIIPKAVLAPDYAASTAD